MNFMSPVVRAVALSVLAFAASSLVGIGFAEPASAATGWTSVSTGNDHTCGIRGGRVYCWGANSEGQLGDGTTDPHPIPQPIASGATDWKSVSAGSSFTCAIRIGRIACWGT